MLRSLIVFCYSLCIVLTSYTFSFSEDTLPTEDNLATTVALKEETPKEGFFKSIFGKMFSKTENVDTENKDQATKDANFTATEPDLSIEDPKSPVPNVVKVDPKNKSTLIQDTKEITRAIDETYSFLYDPTMRPSLLVDIIDNPDRYAVIYLETGGVVLMQLYEDKAPNTIARFKTLVRSNFYNDMDIFRVIPNYFVQTGDPSSSGYGGLGVFHPAEINPEVTFKRGSVAMSNSGNLESDDTQFFITLNNFEWLDGKYTIFGEIVFGMEHIENLKGAFLNQGFVLYPILIVKIEMLSDRSPNQSDDLDRVIPAERRQKALEIQQQQEDKNKKTEAFILEQEDTSVTSIESSAPPALTPTAPAAGAVDPELNVEPEEDLTSVEEDNDSVEDDLTAKSSNPYVR